MQPSIHVLPLQFAAAFMCQWRWEPPLSHTPHLVSPLPTNRGDAYGLVHMSLVHMPQMKAGGGTKMRGVPFPLPCATPFGLCTNWGGFVCSPPSTCPK